ncbi:MAG: pyridoxamine 5'-phosphate oxidase family protein [Pseudomonadota bacterium]|nr:pyridoxamine 5'-phosphate oxidase family protein [Gammaproteobacteria bacterium]MBU1558518.1 pyridoxamine 5'-phosphate oxidase family protein [Gammaproteobacteria bacterium]MBU1628994.1 pyridoxamine 5'-phosphate oxidase family protein [Gammaproteobacteria bacterium]MBU1926158.1 pyridoxamine 5'-phosphate oxidase family protein [Gammaproteobacteria bacterium]MBU2545597.1 pyridoxamine 5'-phosphate oxidase family protein [Gammaproteobacteria bacterium]
MEDLKKEIISCIKESKGVASFATVTPDNKPWVRYVSVSVSDDMTIRFSTCASARKVEQIKKNPEVHLTCGVTDPKNWKDYLQIQGIAHVSTEKAEREAFWNEEIAKYFDGVDDPNYVVVIVKPYRVELCNITEWNPKIWEAETK